MVAAIAMMIVLGAVLGFGLGIADKYLKVEVDERVEKVTEMLPNYNCGGCGYAGCSGLADALVSGEVRWIRCAAAHANRSAGRRSRITSTARRDRMGPAFT